MSRQKSKRGVDVTETFAVDQPIFSFSTVTFRLMEKLSEVLARCLAIPRLVCATDDDVKPSPAHLAKLLTPPPERRVQLLELDAHSQLRSLQRVRRQGADVFFESLEVHNAFLQNLVDKRAC